MNQTMKDNNTNNNINTHVDNIDKDHFETENMVDRNSIRELNKMGTMPVGKLLRSMSIPAMLSMMVQSMYSIINSIFVGYLGEAALTAVTLIFPIQILIIAFGAGTGVGLNSLIARRLGERRFQEANSAATHGLLLALVNWFIFLIFGLFFSSSFVGIFSSNPAIVGDAVSYCTIVTSLSIFIFVQVHVEKIMQATGNMIYPMISSLSGAISNIIINPILIFGLLGAPKLGVTGAAIGTVIAQCISMSVGLFFLFKKKHDVKINFKNFKIDWVTLKNIYAVGLPSIIMQSISSVMILGLNSILISFSEAAVAVLGIYYRLQSIIFMPVFGLNQGTMPVMGYNFGARKKDRLIQAFKLALITAIIIMAIGLVMFQVFPIPLLKLFSASPEMIEIGVIALRTISTSFIFAAVGIIASTLFQATAHGILSSIVSLLRQLILLLPLAWVLSRTMGLNYVWLAFPMSEVFSLMASLFFLQYIYKKEIKHLGDE
ncbi:MAG: MATE family efflux transporter [Anaerovoracaceae bacterium]|jgi:putative MATE family efflux protein